ncbi:hypothetical protein Hanom_Chr14g01297441 [Helianthus anomalus]
MNEPYSILCTNEPTSIKLPKETKLKYFPERKSSPENMTEAGLLSCFTSAVWETENGETLYGLFLLSFSR